MGIRKRYLREAQTAGANAKLQSLTSTSTATEIINYGVTTINSGSTVGTNTFAMADPKDGGLEKALAVTVGTTDAPIVSVSTGVNFFGSTGSTVTFSTGAGEKWMQLVATGATEWAIVAMSTGVTISA
jgi:hypothetical protein